MSKTRNPRTRNLLKLTGSSKPVRLSAADRSMLKDLSKLGIIDTEIASSNHYAHLKNGADRSLNRLEEAGLIQSKKIVKNDRVFKTYTFSTKEIARAWGGNIPTIGSRRMEFHELVTSKLYYKLDKPEDFRVAGQFTKQDQLLCGESLPDAMYTNQHGEIVFVEADSGHYSKTQISKKMREWSNFKQVWGQPNKPHCQIKPSSNIQLFNIND